MNATDPETSLEEPVESAEQPRRLDIAVAISDVGPCKKHVKVTIPREEIDRQMDDSVDRLKRETPLPGFRPGRAPRALFLRRFRKELSDEVKSTLLQNSLKQIDEDYKLEPMSPPKLDLGAIELPLEGALDFELDVEVRPQFAVPNFKGLKIGKPNVEITDEDVELRTRWYLKRYGRLVPKVQGTAELGDTVTADLTFLGPDGAVVGEHKELEFRVARELRLQDGAAPGFDEAIAGAAIGDTRTVEFKAGSSVPVPELRSTTLSLQVHVKDLKTVELPEITPQFLHSVGVLSLEDLHEEVRNRLTHRYAAEARQIVRNQVFDQLIKSTPFDLPTDLVAREERNTVSRMIAQLRDEGVSDDQIRAHVAEMRSNAHESTLRNFKEFLILAKIAEAEGIKVEDEDIEFEIGAIAARNDESPRRVRARLEKESGLDSLSERILDQKVVDLVLQHAEFVPLAVSKNPPDDPVETLEVTAIPVPETSGDEASAEASS